MEILVTNFIKFGTEANILDLYNNGTIYMNPISYFKNIEDSQLRGDYFEAISELYNFPGGTLEIPEINFKTNYINKKLVHHRPVSIGNIYSLYCISTHGFEDFIQLTIHPKVKEFGSHALVILDGKVFLERVINTLKSSKLDWLLGFVKYYNPDAYNGYLSVFDKPIGYEYQKEYRFYIKRDEDSPYKFSIGKLHDIAAVFPTEKVIQKDFYKSI